jgi:hypothetical protein
MSPTIKQKKAVPVFLVVLVLACLAVLRGAQAAQPPDIQNVNEFNPPYRHTFSYRMEPGVNFATDNIALPAGKTLVVEFVSARILLPAGEQPTSLTITSVQESGLDTSAHDLLWNFVAPVEGQRDLFIASQQIRFYVVEGEHIEISCSRNTSEGFAIGHGHITGYLVTTP